MIKRNEYGRLCQAVEREAGKKMETPRDFAWLAEKVEARTKEHLSESTLMRLWGYRKSVITRETTLDILSRYLGYADYVTFCEWRPTDEDAAEQSDEVLANHVYTAEIPAGTQLLLTWQPDRRCVVELGEDGFFTILEAENTKLSVGDRFRCELIVEGEPIIMSQLVHEGKAPMVYMAGKKNGVHFDYITDEMGGVNVEFFMSKMLNYSHLKT